MHWPGVRVIVSPLHPVWQLLGSSRDQRAHFIYGCANEGKEVLECTSVLVAIALQNII